MLPARSSRAVRTESPSRAIAIVKPGSRRRAARRGCWPRRAKRRFPRPCSRRVQADRDAARVHRVGEVARGADAPRGLAHALARALVHQHHRQALDARQLREGGHELHALGAADVRVREHELEGLGGEGLERILGSSTRRACDGRAGAGPRAARCPAPAAGPTSSSRWPLPTGFARTGCASRAGACATAAHDDARPARRARRAARGDS